MDGLSVVCSARGAADALDAVDWDALCRLLFGTTTRQRRADVFWLWDEDLQQPQRRSRSRGLEPRKTAKLLRAGHDVVGSYRARTMEATRRRARPGPRTCYSAARKKRERIGARERQHDEPPYTQGEVRAEGVAHTLPTHYERDATAGTREAYGTHT